MPSDRPDTTPLKPCPFCGGANLVTDQFGHEPTRYAVSCEAADCMVIGPERPTREAAAEAWNAEMKR
jgi:Lar family restriction alleviation protein